MLHVLVLYFDFGKFLAAKRWLSISPNSLLPQKFIDNNIF